MAIGRGFEWTQECYQQSLSSRCWYFTPYDGGVWSDLVREDVELAQIVGMEYALGVVPLWARHVVEGAINQACPCGHYLFPRPYLEVLDAIGTQTPPRVIHSCFTVGRERKRQAMDYCLCLDAWLAGAAPKAPACELLVLGYRKVDWYAICRDLWQTLGERDECKTLLVERVLHSVRWAIKFTVWDGDSASEFGRDRYLGAYSETGDAVSIDGYYERPPADYEQASPRVQQIESRLDGLCPDWDVFRGQLSEWWLCAPKSFRFLERILWAIGQGRPLRSGDKVPGFLRCEDTYPSQDEAAAWWNVFRDALDGWWRGQPRDGPVADDVGSRLGESTPVKCWLVRLFAHKLWRLEENGEQLTHLVRAGHGHRRGTRPI